MSNSPNCSITLVRQMAILNLLHGKITNHKAENEKLDKKHERLSRSIISLCPKRLES